MKPSTRLPVVTATAKLPMAESRMVPLTDRLMTPARSASVSPMEATTMGAAVARTPPGRSRMVRPVHQSTPCRTRRPRLAQVALARPLHQDDEQHQRSLQHAGQRGVELEHDGELDAADVERREEQGDRSHPDGPVEDEHADHQAQVAVAARDGRDQPVVDGGHLHGPGQPGQRRRTRGRPAACTARWARRAGRRAPVAGAGGLEPQAEVGALQQDVDDDDRQDAQAQRPGAQAQPGDGGQGQ